MGRITIRSLRESSGVVMAMWATTAPEAAISRLLTTGSYQEQTGRQLAAACGELSQLAGWVAYDNGEHGLAQRYLTQALAYARHAGDPALAAEILAAQAHQAL